MNRNQFVPVAALTFALICAFAAPRRVAGQDNKTLYPNMASLDQYLMDRDAEIALARSAAPPSIAKDATVMVLGKHGYETVVEGTNGFVCMVGRTWTDGFDRPEFWNPKNRGPACYNPQGRSVGAADRSDEDKLCVGGTIERGNPREYEGCDCERGTAGPRAWRDDLYAVEARAH